MDPYATWVVVYGFTNARQFRSLLARFESYGTVVSQYGGSDYESGNSSWSGPRANSRGEDGSNWVCLCYDTPLQAKKALCQHGTFLNSSPDNGIVGRRDEIAIVGAMRIDDALARKLGLRGPTGGEPVVCQSTSSRSPRRPIGKKTKYGSLSEEDILMAGENVHDDVIIDSELTYKRRDDDLCGKVLAWIFSW